MKKILFLNILILLFNTCDEPNGVNCFQGSELDECGLCCGGDSGVECSTGPETGAMDICGVCFGDNTECAGCTDPDAYNYDSDATISNGECIYDTIFWNLDIGFLMQESFCISSNPNYNASCNQYDSNENTCNSFYDLYECYWIATHEGKVDNPIYWLNSSNTDIEIYTKPTSQPTCIATFESNINGINCSDLSYDTELECELVACEWNEPLTYNPNWDNFSLEVLQQTISNVSGYIFLGFNHPTEERYCADINGEEKCGVIRITQ